MLTPKIFENLPTAMAILVLFKPFSGRSLFIFLAHNFECFTKYDAFRSHSFDYACLRRLRHIVMKRFEIMEKFYSSKALLKMAGGVGYIPPPLDPPLSADVQFTAQNQVKSKKKRS